MARALASDPKLLVLITPTAGVDVRSKETLLGMVEDERRRRHRRAGRLRRTRRPAHLRPGPGHVPGPRGRRDAPRLERPRPGRRDGRGRPRPCLTRCPRRHAPTRPQAAAAAAGAERRDRLRPAARPRPGPGDRRDRGRRPARQPGLPADRQPHQRPADHVGDRLLVLAETLVLIVGKMDLSLESTFGLAPGSRGLADRRLRRRPTASGLLPARAWAVPVTLLVGAADRRVQRRCSSSGSGSTASSSPSAC